PKLYKEGFRGNIWCTQPTSELAMITLRDSVHLIEDEAERHHHDPLYVTEDVEPLEDMWKQLEYHKEKEIMPGVVVSLTDAGHILGSASVKIMADGQQAVFSGDLGNSPVPLLRNTQSVDEADIVIIESTYGNRVHEPSAHRYELLQEAILDTIRSKGTLIIPSFALERTQELLYELNHLHLTRKIPHVPIFLDSPMAIAATEVFRAHTDYFNTEARAQINHGDDLFRFPGLIFTRNSMDSKEILTVPGPKVIIAGSGMMNGGRVMHHLKNYLAKANTILMIIGYQVEGSLGRKLHDGEKVVHIYGQEIHVHAQVRSCGAFSGHADYPRLMHWLNGFHHHPPRKIFVTHGELNSALSFSQAIEDQMGVSSGVPEYGETIDIAHLGNL
ncbi:MAG: metallo-beta-lactamase, partial [Patescibacteria group bacterium]|nr:metallo-beta-lactamase [Patescibacteria group bacterium]